MRFCLRSENLCWRASKTAVQIHLLSRGYKNRMKIRKLKAYAHRCPSCGTVVPGRDFDLKAIATGVITCPHCEGSGPIIVQILASEELSRTWPNMNSDSWRPPLQ